MRLMLSLSSNRCRRDNAAGADDRTVRVRVPSGPHPADVSAADHCLADSGAHFPDLSAVGFARRDRQMCLTIRWNNNVS